MAIFRKVYVKLTVISDRLIRPITFLYGTYIGNMENSTAQERSVKAAIDQRNPTCPENDQFRSFLSLDPLAHT